MTTKRRRRRCKFGLKKTNVVLAFSVSGCFEKEGPAEKAGKNFDKSMDKAGKEIDKTFEKAGRELDKAGEELKDLTNGE